ncbi:MAG TPA: efflux RND transporter periplasmic adaptor subunit [Steroidobacteraceae bacterium]
MNEQEHGTDADSGGFMGFVRKRKIALVVLATIVVLVLLVIRNIHRGPQPQQGGNFRPPGAGRTGGGGGAFGGGGRNNRNGNFNNQAVAVSVAQVTTGDIQIRVPALGTITPLATVTVRTQITGQLQKIGFTEGQLVKQGDFLAQVDPRPYEAALAQDKAALRRDQAQLANAKQDLARFEQLIKEDSVAQQQLDTQRSLTEQYAGTVEADEAMVKTAELNLNYTHIVSPVSGRVGLRQVDVGNYVTSGDTNGIVIVTELAPITAIFNVPEDYVGPLMEQQHKGVALEVDAFDRNNSQKIAAGKLLTLDNQIDTSTGTIRMKAIFDNKDGSLFPNQFVNIQLLQDTLHDQLLMPAAAIHRGAPNGVTSTFVYLVNADKTAAVRAVKLGVQDGDTVAVTEGLAEGDIVVTEGGDRLRDGSPVELPADTPIHTPPPNANKSKFRRNGNFNGGKGRPAGGAGGSRPQ